MSADVERVYLTNVSQSEPPVANLFRFLFPQTLLPPDSSIKLPVSLWINLDMYSRFHRIQINDRAVFFS